MDWYRVRALVLRYSFIYFHSPWRASDIFFWPVMDLLVWGFVSIYLLTIQSKVPMLITFFIGAIIFWNVLFRAQQAVTISFLEDVWSRNLLNIFVAPVRVREFIAATYIAGLIQSLLVIAVMAVLATAFYSFDLFRLGFSLVPLFANLLLMGWAMGMVTTALILRWGHAAEVLNWAAPFLIQPVSAVFYPVTVLPGWLQPVALLIPATHVFEGMRKILGGEPNQAEHLLYAFLLNGIYFLGAGLYFNYMYNEARNKGLLAKLGT